MKTKEPTIEQLKATDNFYKLRQVAKNDSVLAEWIGRSKVTMYTRMRTQLWDKPEIAQINQLISDFNTSL